MLASTTRTTTPAATAAAAAGIALVFVGVLAAGPASVSAATARISTKPLVSAGSGPYAATVWTTSDTTNDTEGMRGVRRKTSPASLARAPRQQREPAPTGLGRPRDVGRTPTQDGEARCEGCERE